METVRRSRISSHDVYSIISSFIIYFNSSILPSALYPTPPWLIAGWAVSMLDSILICFSCIEWISIEVARKMGLKLLYIPRRESQALLASSKSVIALIPIGSFFGHFPWITQILIDLGQRHTDGDRTPYRVCNKSIPNHYLTLGLAHDS